MATIVTRSGKGSPLTNDEVDANFTNLNTDKLESGDTAASLTITSADINGGTIDGVTIGGSSAGAGSFTTLTADGLTVGYDRAGVSGGFILYDDNQSENRLSLITGGGAGVNAVINQSGGAFNITDASINTIASFADSGDISFYEDTGTTAKFFWDASAEALGIGTTSPQQLLHLSATNPGGKIRLEMAQLGVAADDVTGEIEFYQNDSSGAGVNANIKGICTNSVGAGALTFGTGTTSATERMRIDSSGNLGLGVVPNTWSVGKALELGFEGNALWGNAADEIIVVQNAYYNSGWKYATTRPATHYSQYDGGHRWFTAASGTADTALSWTQAMTLDASGNLLVGKTSSDTNVEGSVLFADSATGASAAFTSDGIRTLILNRKTSDGDIAVFRKDGTTVGSIGNIEDLLYIAADDTTDCGLRFDGDNQEISPCTATGVYSDGNIDLGDASGRFKDLYLSGGVYLGGTGAANQLDDYEEGTWTPTLVSSGATYTYPRGQAGYYTKVGDVVVAQFYIGADAAGTTTNSVTIGNLPFTSKNLNSLAQFSATAWVSTAVPIGFTVNNNSTLITMWHQNNGTDLLLASEVTGGYLVGHCIYKAD